MNPGAHAQARVVDANHFEARGNAWVLLRDERVVYRIPKGQVARIEPHESQKSAADAALAWRERANRGGLVIEETGGTARPQTRGTGRAPALEGVSVRITE